MNLASAIQTQVDPLNPDHERFPKFRHATPIHVTLKPGDLLYLPSLYYHHVSQKGDHEGKCIAVNYWYDMEFDIKFAYYQFLRGVSQKFLEKE